MPLRTVSGQIYNMLRYDMTTRVYKNAAKHLFGDRTVWLSSGTECLIIIMERNRMSTFLFVAFAINLGAFNRSAGTEEFVDPALLKR